MKDKEQAFGEFLDMIRNSWTYQLLTVEELEQLDRAFKGGPVRNALKGSWRQRWEILQAVYHAFLEGCGYDGPGWRERERVRFETV